MSDKDMKYCRHLQIEERVILQILSIFLLGNAEICKEHLLRLVAGYHHTSICGDAGFVHICKAGSPCGVR